MINDGNSNVPDNTIALFIDDLAYDFKYEDINSIIEKPSKKRDWFNNHFYKCLPLSIGNQYGYVIKSQYDFDVTWNGGPNKEDLIIRDYPEVGGKTYYPNITSIFGNGIFTVVTPFHIKTPPGVNIMTINPPNFIMPLMTVMTGVVETDNIRQGLTFNIKIQVPNTTISFEKNTPISAFIPVPRYYCDNFELANGEDIFSQNEFDQEMQARIDHGTLRTINNKLHNETNADYSDRLYMRGMDIYGNKFKDHQRP